MTDLSSKKCVPCSIGEPPLTKEQIDEFMQSLDGEWELGNDPDNITKNFDFKDFSQALEFVNRVGELAEEEGHHPNIYIHDYKKVKIELWTHKINGLHENDFILASKIEDLYQNNYES